MSRVFLDTSSLVKLYHAEAGSTALRQQLDMNRDKIFLAELAFVEFTSAFGRKVRRGELDAPTAAASIADFQRDWFNFSHVPLGSTLLTRAAALVQGHHSLALRTLDAIQLAAALAAGPLDAFFTHDDRLRKAATAEGRPVR